jgi:hypothetical protein
MLAVVLIPIELVPALVLEQVLLLVALLALVKASTVSILQ